MTIKPQMVSGMITAFGLANNGVNSFNYPGYVQLLFDSGLYNKANIALQLGGLPSQNVPLIIHIPIQEPLLTTYTNFSDKELKYSIQWASNSLKVFV